MDFYTVSYVESQITSSHTVGFVIFVVILLALLGVGIQVLRNGFTSRYRDLTVILSLIIVFFLGLEYQEYGRVKTTLKIPLEWLNSYIPLVPNAIYQKSN